MSIQEQHHMEYFSSTDSQPRPTLQPSSREALDVGGTSPTDRDTRLRSSILDDDNLNVTLSNPEIVNEDRISSSNSKESNTRKFAQILKKLNLVNSHLNSSTIIFIEKDHEQ